MSQPIGIGWAPANNLGWGVMGLKIVLELKRSRLREPVYVHDFITNTLSLSQFEARLLEHALRQHRETLKQVNAVGRAKLTVNFPVIHSLNYDLASVVGIPVEAPQNFGIAFVENTHLTENSIRNGKSLDGIIAGSTWCAQHLERSGLTNVSVWTQGVDTTIFHPAPRNDYFADRFVVFSGGKLEYRKGQDLVIEAFRRFRERHDDALLMTSWGNLWPELVGSMSRSKCLSVGPVWDEDNQLDQVRWLERVGIPPNSVLPMPMVPNDQMGMVIREADVALFPNRCEAGTNLVAMEALACGVPTILSANTGHLDLLSRVPALSLEHQTPVAPLGLGDGVEGWGESSVDEMVEALETVYQNRSQARERGAQCAQIMQDWDWKNQVPRLIQLI